MPMLSIPRARAIAVAVTFAVAALLVQPTSAASGDRLAQASPPPSSAASAPAAKATTPRRTRADFVEARIKALHEQLKITPDEEPQWNAVAQAMREDSKAVSDLIAQRNKSAKTMSAIDNLRSYQAIAKAHLDGLDHLIPAFQALYSAMPDAQKKIADAVFSRRPTRPARKRGG